MVMTPYEWDERVAYLSGLLRKNEIHPISAIADLTLLYRHIDGEVFKASKINDKRQKKFLAVCQEADVDITGIAEIVKKQRLYETKKECS